MYRRSFCLQALGTGIGWAASQTAAGLGIRSLGKPAPEELPKPQAMIVSTTGPRAIQSGLDVMRQGGSAADAVLTTALSQIALCAGCWVSYAGRLTATYFDAERGQIQTLNSCYDAPRNEKDPLSIPAPTEPSGRNVLVPGFMAGVEAFHRKFGKTVFADLFRPAIEMAEEGMPLSPQLAHLIKQKQQVLTRYPGGRSVFLNDRGQLYSAGELFQQPELAVTLTEVARQGADYMYDGPWGRRLVTLVQQQGGHLGIEDLQRYSPTWSKPLTTTFADGTSISGLPAPNRGCSLAIACLNLADHAGLSSLGHYLESPQALRTVLDIELAMKVINLPRGRVELGRALGREQLQPEHFADRQLGGELWDLVRSPKWEPLIDRLQNNQAPQPSEHSDAIVAADAEGNFAAMLHTINTAGWGRTGFFVDGVSIPDSGAVQQTAVKAAGPGGRIADYGPPIIATRQGLPVLAGSATGSGNVNASWQNFLNVLVYKRSPQAAADTPNFYHRTFEQAALKPEFASKAKAAGIHFKLLGQFPGSGMGYWTGIGRDPSGGVLQAGKIRKLDGVALHF